MISINTPKELFEQSKIQLIKWNIINKELIYDYLIYSVIPVTDVNISRKYRDYSSKGRLDKSVKLFQDNELNALSYLNHIEGFDGVSKCNNIRKKKYDDYLNTIRDLKGGNWNASHTKSGCDNENYIHNLKDYIILQPSEILRQVLLCKSTNRTFMDDNSLYRFNKNQNSNMAYIKAILEYRSKYYQKEKDLRRKARREAFRQIEEEKFNINVQRYKRKIEKVKGCLLKNNQ